MLESVIPADSRRSYAWAEGQSISPIVLDTIGTSALVPTRSAHDRSLFVVAVVVAVLVHAGIVAALSRPVESQLGARGVDLDAISVEVALVPVTALESLIARPEAAAGAAGPVDITDGAQTPPAPPVATKQEREREQKVELALDKLLDLEPAQIVVPPERKELVRPPVGDPVQPKRPDPAPVAPSAPVGGIAARAIEDKGSTVLGAAAARPGEVQRYARNVVEALSRSRPRGGVGSTRGTVKVAFSITENGSLAAVRVVMSSGSAQLDATALAAVQKVRFPPPPPGMSMAQLTYEVPYHFR